MKTFTLPLLFLFSFIVMFANAQTLINKVWQQATGHPTLAYDHIATARQGSEVFIVGNTYHFGEQENFLITKYNTSGTLLWQKEFNSLTDDRDFGMDAYIKGTHLYVTGFSWDSVNNDADIVTLKLTLDSGNTVWTATYAGTYGGYDAAAGVRVDNSDNVYVAGSEQTGIMDSRMVVIKYNSAGSQQWISGYDSTGYFDGAVALDIDASGSRLKTIGFSGSAFSSWDFVTHEFNSSGSVTGYSRSANPNGGISQPIGFTQDYSGDLYVLGNIALSPTNNDIKLIKYDTLFNQVWVRTFGCADSLDDEATAIAIDAQGKVLISGFTSRSNGANDMLTLKYDKNGNIVWSRTISSPDLSQNATGRDIKVENNANSTIYVTGKSYNNSNYDYLTASYTKDGDLRWVKYFDDSTGSNDVAIDIMLDISNNVIVSGICTKDTNTRYVSVKYEQWEVDTAKFYDSAYAPICNRYQIVLRLDSAAVIKDSIDKIDIQFSNPSFFLKQYAIDSINKKLSSFLDRAIISRAYPQMKTDVTFTITRLNDTIPVPSLWTTLIINYNSSGSLPRILDSLETLFPIVRWAEPNYLFQPSSPNDPNFSNQISLLDPGHHGGDINVGPVWDNYHEYGKPFVKVGVLDQGINRVYDDFGNSNPDKVDGYNFSSWGSVYDYSGGGSGQHGNMVASVIGAIGNNNIQIAGIAGGNSTNATDLGVKLYGMKIEGAFGVSNSAVLSNAIAQSSLNVPSWNYGWGLDIINIAYNAYINHNVNGNVVAGSPFYGISEALHFANRCQVTTVISSGNSGSNFVQAPANVEDNWVIAVGGSDIDGLYNNSSYGSQIDVTASSDGSAWSIFSNTTTTSFNGTSSASSHVSGVASLLLSYYNSSTPNISNLAPEDVEFILQESAKDISASPASAGIDDYTGYGLLNCGSAFDLVSKPTHTVKHLSYLKNQLQFHSVGHIITTTNTGMDVYLTSDYGNFEGGTLYKADVREVESTFNYSNMINFGDVVQYGWSRSSASSLFGPTYILLGNSFVNPYEKLSISTPADQSSISFKSYAYKMYDAQTNTFLGWIPFEPSNINGLHPSLEEAFTLLIYNASITGENAIEEGGDYISVFPNPSQFANTILINQQQAENVSIMLFNTEGEFMKQVTDQNFSKGSHTFDVNIQDIATGIYYYKIRLGNSNTYHLKFMKL